jgi:hypothetical protein
MEAAPCLGLLGVHPQAKRPSAESNGWWNSQEKMEKLNKYDLALAYVSIFFGVTIQWIHTVVYYQLFIEVRRIDSQAVIFLEPQMFSFPPDTRSCSNWIHWNSFNFWLYWSWHHPLQPMVVWDGNEKDMEIFYPEGPPARESISSQRLICCSA